VFRSDCVFKPDLPGAWFGSGLAIESAIDYLAHLLEPPVSPGSAALPGSGGQGGANLSDFEF